MLRDISGEDWLLAKIVGPVVEYAMIKYKSHRRLSPTIGLDEIASEFAEKKAKKMTFKRCK